MPSSHASPAHILAKPAAIILPIALPVPALVSIVDRAAHVAMDTTMEEHPPAYLVIIAVSLVPMALPVSLATPPISVPCRTRAVSA